MATYVRFDPVLGEDTRLMSISYENERGEEICVDGSWYEVWHEDGKIVYRLKNLFNVEDGVELPFNEEYFSHLTFIGVNVENEETGEIIDLLDAEINYVF